MTPLNRGVVSLTRVAIAVLAAAPPMIAGFTRPEDGEGLIGVLPLTPPPRVPDGVAVVGIAVGDLVRVGNPEGTLVGALDGVAVFTGTLIVRTLTGVLGAAFGGVALGPLAGTVVGTFVGAGVAAGDLVGVEDRVGGRLGAACEGVAAGALVGGGGVGRDFVGAGVTTRGGCAGTGVGAFVGVGVAAGAAGG